MKAQQQGTTNERKSQQHKIAPTKRYARGSALCNSRFIFKQTKNVAKRFEAQNVRKKRKSGL